MVITTCILFLKKKGIMKGTLNIKKRRFHIKLIISNANKLVPVHLHQLDINTKQYIGKKVVSHSMIF